MSNLNIATAKEWGFTPEEAAFAAAIDELAADHQKRGLTNEGVCKVYECKLTHAKEKLPGRGQVSSVADGDQPNTASARQPENGGGDHADPVQQDHVVCVSPAVPTNAPNATQSRAGEDPPSDASQGQEMDVPPARDPYSPTPDGGQPSSAATSGQHAVASIGPQTAAGDQTSHVAQSDHLVGVSGRQPSIAQPGRTVTGKTPAQPKPMAQTKRGGLDPHGRSLIHNQRPSPEAMRAARVAGHHSVPTIFDRFKILDGRRIGDVRTNEYRLQAAANVRFASLFLMLDDVARKLGKTGPGVVTRDLLSAKQMEKLIVDSGVILEGKISEGILIAPDGKLSLVKKRPPDAEVLT